MKGFENEINNLHKKEVDSLRKEMSDNIEPFIDQVRSEGYESIEEYDRAVMKRMGIGVLIAICGIVVAFFVWMFFCTFISQSKAVNEKYSREDIHTNRRRHQ